jgi:hypothetical protein
MAKVIITLTDVESDDEGRPAMVMATIACEPKFNEGDKATPAQLAGARILHNLSAASQPTGAPTGQPQVSG